MKNDTEVKAISFCFHLFMASKKEKSKHLLGRAIDIQKPGLDQIEEVKAIIRAFENELQAGEATPSQILRRLGALKTAIKRSRQMTTPTKAAAVSIVDEAIQRIRTQYGVSSKSTKSDSGKKRRRRSRKKKKADVVTVVINENEGEEEE